jgi:hypothetical protein
MPKIILKASIEWYERGYERREYAAGEADVSDECAAVALAEGWAEQLGEPVQPSRGAIAPADGQVAAASADFADTQPAETAALPGAPETADAAPKRRKA